MHKKDSRRVVNAAHELRDAEVRYRSLRSQLAKARERKKSAMNDLIRAFVSQVVDEELAKV